MRYSLVQTGAPTSQPVTVAEAKAQCRIDADLADEDSLIRTYIEAATAQVETETGRQLMQATYMMQFEAFPACGLILLPRPPLLGVAAILYVDTDGAIQTWANVVDDPATLLIDETVTLYQVDTQSEPGILYPLYGTSWPSTRSQHNAVTIMFTAGYGAPEDVPQPLRVAILLWVADLYMRREPTGDRQAYVMPLSVERLVWPYRRPEVLVG